MREVITVQLGQLANYVGTHFWNTQEAYFNYGDAGDDTKPESLNHDVLYRAGISPTGIETYTPRVLMYDLRGGFGSLQKYNKLFGGDAEEAGALPWDQGVNTVRSDPYPKSAYQQYLERLEENPDIELQDAPADLDATNKTWSDFNRIYFHPRSINPITTHQMEDTINPFDAYPVGREAYADFEKETDTFDDCFRLFAEECDNLQGFHILASVDDAFGGFTEGLLHDIRDEFPKSAVLTFGLQSWVTPTSERTQIQLAFNRALSMSKVLDLSTLYVPLYTPSPEKMSKSPFVKPNCNLMYHTSAILSAAIETMSLPCRLKRDAITMSDMLGKLDSQKTTKLGGAAVALPLPLLTDGFGATVGRWKDNLLPLVNLSGGSDEARSGQVFGEDVVVRGLPRSSVSPDYGLYQYLQQLYQSFTSGEIRFIDNVPYPLPDSYPRFFDPHFNANGLWSERIDASYPESIPALSRLYTGSDLGDQVDNLVAQITPFAFRRMTGYGDGNYGISQEDFDETREDLLRLSEAYTSDPDGMFD